MSLAGTLDLSTVVESELRKYDSLRLAYRALEEVNPHHELLYYVRLEEYPTEDLPAPRLSEVFPVSVSVQYHQKFQEKYNPSDTSDKDGLPTGLERFIHDLELASKTTHQTQIHPTSFGQGPDNMVPSSCC